MRKILCIESFYKYEKLRNALMHRGSIFDVVKTLDEAKRLLEHNDAHGYELVITNLIFHGEQAYSSKLKTFDGLDFIISALRKEKGFENVDINPDKLIIYTIVHPKTVVNSKGILKLKREEFHGKTVGEVLTILGVDIDRSYLYKDSTVDYYTVLDYIDRLSESNQ